jgi:hypothetical protein
MESVGATGGDRESERDGMTPQQQSDLLTAARAALERLRHTTHRTECRYALLVSKNVIIGDLETEKQFCTCGLWQTREALRAAIEAAGAEGGTE